MKSEVHPEKSSLQGPTLKATEAQPRWGWLFPPADTAVLGSSILLQTLPPLVPRPRACATCPQHRSLQILQGQAAAQLSLVHVLELKNTHQSNGYGPTAGAQRCPKLSGVWCGCSLCGLEQTHPEQARNPSLWYSPQVFIFKQESRAEMKNVKSNSSSKSTGTVLTSKMAGAQKPSRATLSSLTMLFFHCRCDWNCSGLTLELPPSSQAD